MLRLHLHRSDTTGSLHFATVRTLEEATAAVKTYDRAHAALEATSFEAPATDVVREWEGSDVWAEDLETGVWYLFDDEWTVVS